MDYIYSDVKIDNNNEFIDIEGQDLNELNNLSKVNIFVGENNSRKSRLLRQIANEKNVVFKLRNLDLNQLAEQLDNIREGINKIFEKHDNVVSFSAGDKSFNSSNLDILRYYRDYRNYFNDSYFNKEQGDNIIALKEIFNHLLKHNYVMQQHIAGRSSIAEFEMDMKNYLQSVQSIIDQLDLYVFDKKNFIKAYIPILRSLDCFDQYTSREVSDFYEERINKNYKFTQSEDFKIYTGQRMYEDVKAMLLGNRQEREKIRKFEDFLKNYVYEGKKVEIIPSVSSDVLNIRIDNDEKKIFDLGDGIQSLIMLIFPMYVIDSGIFCIEEPETHLHPGVQRKFINIITKHFTNHQYFITTHSNHLLDLTLDFDNISIYNFKKIPDLENKTQVEQVSSGNNSTLDLLGVKNSSVFLSNSTIWVEGITDRLYIRKFLELYQETGVEKIFEDKDYSFVEYSGSNITHWSFLDGDDPTMNVDRLCSKLILITDKDGDSKMERKEKLEEKLKERYICLECNEIENILTLKTIGKVIQSYEKGGNFKMPESIEDDAHINTKLGNFIEQEVFKDQDIKRNGGYKTDAGSIKDKPRFCKRAIKELKSYDDLSDTAKALTEKIYKFIIENKV